MQVPDLHISTIPTDPPKHELDRTTREHSTPLPCSVPDGYLAGCVHATPAISPPPVCIISSHNEIAEVLRLTGICGQYCKVSTHTGLQWYGAQSTQADHYTNSFHCASHPPCLHLILSSLWYSHDP